MSRWFVRYRIEQYYGLKERARGRAAERDVTLDTRSSRIGSKIFEAEHISKAFGDKVILNDFSYTFARGEKVGVTPRPAALPRARSFSP